MHSKRVAEIVSINHSENGKNPIKSLWKLFQSFESFTKVTILTFLLIIISTPFIVGNRQIFTPKAQEQGAQFTCPSLPEEQIGKKHDINNTKNIASVLDTLSRNISKSHGNYKNAPDSGKPKIQEGLYDLVSKRKAALIETMRQDPDLALSSILSSQEQTTLNSLSQNCVETQTTIEGTLEVLHADFFDGKESATYYTLVTQNNERVTLHIAHPNKALISSMKIGVKGHRLDNDMLIDASNPDNLSVLSLSAQPSSGLLIKKAYADVPDAKGVQQTVVLMVNFQNTTQPALTQAEVNDIVFNQVNNYYTETSYNQTSFAGSVHGWYTIPINQKCGTFETTSEAIKAADADVNYTQFSRLLIIAPFGPSCYWGGQSTVGKVSVSTPDGNVSMSKSWVVSGSTNLFYAGHEFGHALGAHHASFLNCGNVAVSDTGCSVDEYGDSYDIMGGLLTITGHWNAPHKDYIGWFSPSQLQTITTNGAYALEPFETITSGLKAIKIQRASNDYLYVEYRQPIGADAGIAKLLPSSDVFNGALIHIDPIPYKPYLIDTTPPADKLITVIPVGGTFTDPASKSTVSVNSKTDSALTVNVSLCKTDWTPPTVAITDPPSGTTVSGTITMTADASDTSGIQKVEFYNSSSLVGTATTSPYTISLDTTHMPNGNNSFNAWAYDNSGIICGVSGNVKSSTYVQLNIANTDSIPPTVSITSPLDGSVVSSPVTVSAIASDDVGVYKVEFWKDSDTLPFNFTFSPPYTATVSLNPDTHTITVKAYDFVGNVTSSGVTISVNASTPTPTPLPTATPTPTPTPPDITKPTVSITSPLNGATVARRSTVTIAATASDNVSVKKVEFYASGTLKCTDTTSPYSCLWSVPSSPNKTYQLQAKAYDPSNNIGSSSIVTVTAK